mmetsp:Transcript_72460/g.155168  ORF Transcript_72460/g.155168 Transcript_72460/m.155168 type:complete len:391 (+) Transcript_72460:692-1864(+)
MAELPVNFEKEKCEPPSPEEPKTVTPRNPKTWKAVLILADCAGLKNMQTCRCCCKKASHSPRECPAFTAWSHRRSQEAAEREPSDSERTWGRRGRVASSVTKSSMAWPKPLPSSVDAEVFVLETMVSTFSPKDAIIFVSRLPSPKLSPPGLPWFSVSKWTFAMLSLGHSLALCKPNCASEKPKVPGPQTICKVVSLLASKSTGMPYAFFMFPTVYLGPGHMAARPLLCKGGWSTAAPPAMSGSRCTRNSTEAGRRSAESSGDPADALAEAAKLAVTVSLSAETRMEEASAPKARNQDWASSMSPSVAPMRAATPSAVRCCKYLGLSGFATSQKSRSSSPKLRCRKCATISRSPGCNPSAAWPQTQAKKTVANGIVIVAGRGGVAHAGLRS